MFSQERQEGKERKRKSVDSKQVAWIAPNKNWEAERAGYKMVDDGIRGAALCRCLLITGLRPNLISHPYL